MTVIVDGCIVYGSTPARLRNDVVVAPVAPFVERVARRIERGTENGGLTFERGGRTLRIAIGSVVAHGDSAAQSLPIAPYLRAGEPIIPLAAVARALGAEVAYDGPSRTLRIELPDEPLSTMTPYAEWSPPPGPLPTFTPTPTPAPQATVTGIPRPRRTPIVVEPQGG